MRRLHQSFLLEMDFQKEPLPSFIFRRGRKGLVMNSKVDIFNTMSCTFLGFGKVGTLQSFKTLMTNLVAFFSVLLKKSLFASGEDDEQKTREDNLLQPL